MRRPRTQPHDRAGPRPRVLVSARNSTDEFRKKRYSIEALLPRPAQREGLRRENCGQPTVEAGHKPLIIDLTFDATLTCGFRPDDFSIVLSGVMRSIAGPKARVNPHVEAFCPAHPGAMELTEPTGSLRSVEHAFILGREAVENRKGIRVCEIITGRSSAWIERTVRDREVASSNLVAPICKSMWHNNLQRSTYEHV